MFETTLIESQGRRPSKAQLYFLPIAVAIHAAVLSSLVVAQYWTIDVVPEPPIQVSFVQAMSAPPPPPPPPPPPKKAAVEAPKPIETTAPVQPVEIPQETKKGADDSGMEGGVEGGVEGGIEGGVLGGVVGGVPGGVVSAAVEPPPEEILRVAGSIEPPVALQRVPPAYTEIARKARIQGVVIVEAIIDKSGNVTNVRILKGLPMGLDQAAADAVKMWRFKPAMLNGRPVSVYFNLTVNFKLQ